MKLPEYPTPPPPTRDEQLALLSDVISQRGMSERYKSVDEDWIWANAKEEEATARIKAHGDSITSQVRVEMDSYPSTTIKRIWIGEQIAWMCVCSRDNFNRSEYTLTDFTF